MTSGDTAGMGEETEEIMRRAGISHLVAVSGETVR
ncbi:MAG TPA: ComEC/Rec2 family competence protein [Brevibacterium sp.]|nr:ComEC/Rec2 family competence protein [Brevibacterium sp.]